MDKTIEKLHADISVAFGKADKSEELVKTLRVKNENLFNLIAQYEEENITKRKEMVELKLKLLSAEKNSGIQKTVVEKMEKENGDLQKRIAVLKTQLKEAKDRAMELANELLAEELENFKLNEGKIRLEENLKEVTDRALELANELHSEELENFEANEAKIKLEQQLKEEFVQHNKMMEEYQQIVEEEIAKLKLEKAELQKIIEDQKQMISRRKAKHTKATAHVKNLKYENGKLKNIISFKDDVIQKLSDRIAELEENSRLHQNNGEFYDFDNDFDALDIEELDEQRGQSSDDDDEGIGSEEEIHRQPEMHRRHYSRGRPRLPYDPAKEVGRRKGRKRAADSHKLSKENPTTRSYELRKRKKLS